MSLPSRECGLKSAEGKWLIQHPDVTPLAGVWIEIYDRLYKVWQDMVTPLAGVWIEI